MTIDIGPGAINRANTWAYGKTTLVVDNPANATGTIDTIEIWSTGASDIANCVVGTFYFVSGTDYKCRDSEAIGTVVKGSKQTFSGLSIDVETSDLLGNYYTWGDMEWDFSGAGGAYWYTGEAIDPADQATYTLYSDDTMSIYGTGTEAGGGWTTIAKVNSVTEAALGKFIGVDKASIAKISGVAV